MFNIRSFFVIFIAALVVVGGCGTSDERTKRVSVSGTVTLEGQPVEGARVVFYPLSNGLAAAQGKTDESGVYHLTTFEKNDGAMPGEYRVLVTKKTMTNNMTAEESSEYFSRTGKAPPIPEFHDELPEKYADPTTTDLNGVVKPAGSNNFNFDLKE